MNELQAASANFELIQANGVDALLSGIRPAWQAKNLIQRVKKLLPTDPSSACQRIFNASVHDLKEKIIIMGVDIASEVATAFRMPSINSAEDIENYNTSRLLELAWRIGLLTRPEYKKIARVYDIRKDLEHEDDEYEAGIEECIYIFSACINIILSRDHIELIRITDVKDIVQSSSPTKVNEILVEEYSQAPKSRQIDIFKFLQSEALNPKQSDIVRQNAYSALADLSPHAKQSALLEVATIQVEHIGKRSPKLDEVRVAVVSKTFPYFKQAQIKGFFSDYLLLMKREGYSWRKSNVHGELLRNLFEIEGLTYCPDATVYDYVEWLFLCYLGEPGGYGMGANRPVFYSNSGAPIAYDILKLSKLKVQPILTKIQANKTIKNAISNGAIKSRFENLLDIFE